MANEETQDQSATVGEHRPGYSSELNDTELGILFSLLNRAVESGQFGVQSESQGMGGPGHLKAVRLEDPDGEPVALQISPIAVRYLHTGEAADMARCLSEVE